MPTEGRDIYYYQLYYPIYRCLYCVAAASVGRQREELRTPVDHGRHSCACNISSMYR